MWICENNVHGSAMLRGRTGVVSKVNKNIGDKVREWLIIVNTVQPLQVRQENENEIFIYL